MLADEVDKKLITKKDPQPLPSFTQYMKELFFGCSTGRKQQTNKPSGMEMHGWVKEPPQCK